MYIYISPDIYIYIGQTKQFNWGAEWETLTRSNCFVWPGLAFPLRTPVWKKYPHLNKKKNIGRSSCGGLWAKRRDHKKKWKKEEQKDRQSDVVVVEVCERKEVFANEHGEPQGEVSVDTVRKSLAGG